MKNIKHCIDENICCGCGCCEALCPTNAITMGVDKYFFSLPRLDEDKCIYCGKCFNACPAVNKELHYPRKAYAGVNLDGEVLVKSSSGGIFFELAGRVLEKGGAVFGCTMDKKFRVKHIMITDRCDLNSVLRSKYVQSDMSEVFLGIKEALAVYDTVLFCGTPCQASAINNFVGEKNREKLILVDIVCHGVPSQRIFDDYRHFLEQKKGKKIEKYLFRYKTGATAGMDCYSAYKYEGSGKYHVRNWPEDSYNWLYMQSVIYRDSCYSCQYTKKERAGDLTICDFWGWEDHHGEQFTHFDSVSAVLINTEKGEKVFDEVLNTDRIKAVTSHVDKVCEKNGCLSEPSTRHRERNNVLDMWINNGYAKVDVLFKKQNRKNRVKYMLLRHMPKAFTVKIKRLLGK